MFEFFKKYGFLIKVYVIIIVIINLVLAGMYFRFKKTLTKQKLLIQDILLKKNSSKQLGTHDTHDVGTQLTKNNINIKIEEV
jgi:hypothetical protein